MVVIPTNGPNWTPNMDGQESNKSNDEQDKVILVQMQRHYDLAMIFKDSKIGKKYQFR